mmetsp:Transcript_18058/g.39468  ORF Transcript_18058/g.39468 Transcript_18058/m.39468 type:complete len:300 (+) Transcript_18058:379-1278(+)
MGIHGGISGGCELLSGSDGLFTQLFLAGTAFGSLVVKRQRERPRRPIKIWAFDVTKQGFAAAAAHLCGMMWAIIMASLTMENASECAWYFVVFFVDTTVGVVVALYLHRVVVRAVCKRFVTNDGEPRESDPSLKSLPVYVRNWGFSLAQCGYYGDPPSLKVFMPQMIEWVLCVIAGRIACGAMVFISAGVLGHIARYIDNLFHALIPNNAEANSAELWAVMVCGPLTMNIIQVLVQDAFLKFRGRHTPDRLPDHASHSLLEPFAHSKNNEHCAHAPQKAPGVEQSWWYWLKRTYSSTSD